MRPLSILFLGTQIATGGAQKVLLDQARWFIDRGHTVTAAFIYDKEGLHKKWQEANAFPIICLCAFRAGAGALEKSLSVIRGLWSLWKLVYRERYDVIETFTLDSNVLGLPLAWWAGIPVRIATYHF
ncbi:MAG: glycosyltransferase family 4 protein, partial [Chloroflexi bacterium]|nr:glycosyltransferase family 4 protein [Chloroflexota bacterium]